MTDTHLPDAETLMEQLRDPATILANALDRIHRADAVQADLKEIHPQASRYAELVAYRDHLSATADTLSFIAKTASELATAEADAQQGRLITSIDGFLDDPEGQQAYPAPAGEYEPQPTNGVRFTATVVGAYMGRVAGREWSYIPGHGFIDVTDGGELADRGFELKGRVVSATPDHVLCVTDGGVSVALPRALIVESPDE
jgi:hypothetical protein